MVAAPIWASEGWEVLASGDDCEGTEKYKNGEIVGLGLIRDVQEVSSYSWNG